MRNNEIKIIKKTPAGSRQFHYLTGKHKMFNVTVAAKFSTHAKIKYTQLQLVSSGLMYVKKIHQFLSNIKKRWIRRKIGSRFLPHGVHVNAAP